MIICAAIRVRTTWISDPFRQTIIPCWRHAKGYEILHDLCPEKKLHCGAEEGFIDHNGNFLTRKEAYDEAIKCGQLSASTRWYKEDHGDTELYSEDLY